MSTVPEILGNVQEPASDGREDFHAIRRTGIGGSDAAAVVGLNPYKTPYEVYLEKRGEIAPADLSEVAPVKWGIRLEDAVAEEYMERTGKTVHRVLRTLRHPEHTFMLAHLDRRVVGEKRGLEIKTAGQWAALSDDWGPSGTDHVPEQYLIQCQHYMAVTGYEVFDLAVLIAGNDFRIYEIPRDDDIVAMLVGAERGFWSCVEQGVPPSISTIADARKRFPSAQSRSVEASAEIADRIVRMRLLAQDVAQLESQYEAEAAQVMAFMGEADTLVRGSQKLCTWKTRRAFDAKRFVDEQPDVSKQYSTLELDTTRLRTEQAKLYESYMAAGTRVFSLAKGGA